jgi:glutaredoxin
MHPEAAPDSRNGSTVRSTAFSQEESMKKVVLLLALLLAQGAHAQSVYRWVDKDGKVFYSDTPPPNDAKNIQQKRLGSGVTVDQELPYAVKVAMEKSPVTLFVTSTSCGDPCSDARALLAKRGIVYTERDPERSAADSEALKKAAGTPVVPFMLVGDRQLRGFLAESWESALDSAGYPRTNPFTKAPEPKKSEPAKPAADSSKADPAK